MSLDPADTMDTATVLDNHGVLLDRHAATLSSFDSRLSDLSARLAGLTLSGGPSAPPAYPREPSVATPRHFDGEAGLCRSFLMQCSLVFDLQPRAYPTDRSRVAYLINLLSGRALQWATALWGTNDPVLSTYAGFTSELQRVFGHPTRQAEASRRLHALRQGGRSVADYSIEFRTLATESGWRDDHALQSAFYHGLSEGIKDELTTRDEPEDLNTLVSLSIRIDDRLRARRRERSHRPATSASSSPLPFSPAPPRLALPSSSPPSPSSPLGPGEEPMQLGRARLTAEERERRIREGHCLYCGRTGHFISACPIRPGKDWTRR